MCLITWSRHSEITRNRLFLHIFAQFSKGKKTQKTIQEEEAEEEEDREEHCRKSNRLKERKEKARVDYSKRAVLCVHVTRPQCVQTFEADPTSVHGCRL